MPKRKQRIKWAAIATGIGAIVTGSVVPIINAIKSEESQIVQLKNDIHRWIDRLYEDISEVQDQDSLSHKQIQELKLEIEKLKAALQVLHANDGNEKQQLTQLQQQLLLIQSSVNSLGHMFG